MSASKVHRSAVGTFHPDPRADGASWTVNDVRGTMDRGPSCDECGACECGEHAVSSNVFEDPCVGLSFAFVCLDGGEALCEACAGEVVEVVDCDCGGREVS